MRKAVVDGGGAVFQASLQQHGRGRDIGLVGARPVGLGDEAFPGHAERVVLGRRQGVAALIVGVIDDAKRVVKDVIVFRDHVDPPCGIYDRPQMEMVIGKLHPDRGHLVGRLVDGEWRKKVANLATKVLGRQLTIRGQALKRHDQATIAPKFVVLAGLDPVPGLPPQVGDPPVDQLGSRVGVAKKLEPEKAGDLDLQGLGAQAVERRRLAVLERASIVLQGCDRDAEVQCLGAQLLEELDARNFVRDS